MGSERWGEQRHRALRRPVEASSDATAGTGRRSTGPTVSPPADFRSLDFSRLWANRATTVAVERALLEGWLSRVDGRRIAELGTGEGRLTPSVHRWASEYVGVDLHAEFLSRLPWDRAPSHSLRIASDVRSVPLRARTLTAAVAVRIYNFLEDPIPFLRESARLLIPGGHLILAYQPRPSIASFLDDLRARPIDPYGGHRTSWTWSRFPVLPGAPGPFPSWAPTREAVRSALAAAGFEGVASVASGIEDYRLLKRLPASWFVRLASPLDRLMLAPTQWILARTPPRRDSEPWVPFEQILDCDACLDADTKCGRHHLVGAS